MERIYRAARVEVKWQLARMMEVDEQLRSPKACYYLRLLGFIATKLGK